MTVALRDTHGMAIDLAHSRKAVMSRLLPDTGLCGSMGHPLKAISIGGLSDPERHACDECGEARRGKGDAIRLGHEHIASWACRT